MIPVKPLEMWKFALGVSLVLVRALEGPLTKSPESEYPAKFSPAPINDYLILIARTWSPASNEI